MVILMFGLLGVAGLLVNGISNTASSESMTKANQLLADMADRMRANPAVAVSAGSEYGHNFGTAIPAATSTTIALKDLRQWLTAVQGQLPQGDGNITVDNTKRKVLIEIRWTKCMGTLSQADQTACNDSPSTAFQSVTMDLRI